MLLINSGWENFWELTLVTKNNIKKLVQIFWAERLKFQLVGTTTAPAWGAGEPEQDEEEEEGEDGVLVAGHAAQLGVARAQ